jgi:hypothetical protein
MLCVAPFASAQKTTTPPATAVAADILPGGVATEWETRERLAELARNTRALEPVLAEIKPNDWVAKGASETYVNQARTVRSLALHVIATSKKLADKPEHLPTAIETLFRIQTLERFAGSLAEGIRRYQGVALANRFMEVVAPVAGSGEALRQHVLDVAAMRDLEFDILRDEAQRCRGQVIKQSDNTQRRNRKVTK